MPRFEVFLVRGDRSAIKPERLGEIDAPTAGWALRNAQCDFAYGQPFTKSRIAVVGDIAGECAGYLAHLLADPTNRAGLYLTVGIFAAYAIGSR